MIIKVCGLREPENLSALLDLEVDWVGFIFYPGSKRFVEGEALMNWIGQHQDQFGRVKRVGVFVNAGIADVLNTVHDYQLDIVQLHGAEQPQYCAELNTIWGSGTMKQAQLMKAFQIEEAADFELCQSYEPFCDYFLFDTKSDQYGGTGRSFDWRLLEQYTGSKPFLLSGGLDEGMEAAIQKIDHPQFFGIDVNSRFESEPGLKDIDKVSRFIKNIRP